MNLNDLVKKHMVGVGESALIVNKKERLFNRKIFYESISPVVLLNNRKENARLELKLSAVTSIARGESSNATFDVIDKKVFKPLKDAIKAVLELIQNIINQVIRAVSAMGTNYKWAMNKLKKIELTDVESPFELSVGKHIYDQFNDGNTSGSVVDNFREILKDYNKILNIYSQRMKDVLSGKSIEPVKKGFVDYDKAPDSSVLEKFTITITNKDDLEYLLSCLDKEVITLDGFTTTMNNLKKSIDKSKKEFTKVVKGNIEDNNNILSDMKEHMDLFQKHISKRYALLMKVVGEDLKLIGKIYKINKANIKKK